MFRKSILFSVFVAFVCAQSFADTNALVLSKIQKDSAALSKLIKDGSILRAESSLFGTPSGSITVTYRSGEKMRTDREAWGMKSSIIYDGREFWEVSRAGVRQITDEKAISELRIGIDQNNPFKNALNWKIESSTVFNGKKCYVIRCETEEKVGDDVAKGSMLSVIDKKQLITYKSETELTSNGRTVKLNILYSDYAKIDKKTLYPMKTEVFLDGRQAQTLVIRAFQVHQKLSDDIFEPEEVLKKEYSASAQNNNDSGSIFNSLMQGGGN